MGNILDVPEVNLNSLIQSFGLSAARDSGHCCERNSTAWVSRTAADVERWRSQVIPCIMPISSTYSEVLVCLTGGGAFDVSNLVECYHD